MNLLVHLACADVKLAQTAVDVVEVADCLSCALERVPRILSLSSKVIRDLLLRCPDCCRRPWSTILLAVPRHVSLPD